jgi:hypothetical protein
MSNSMRNDYFSFMSDKWEKKQSHGSAAAQPIKPEMTGDTIEFVEQPQFVEEPQIEVIESVASDTIIEQIFKRRINAG